MRAAAEDVLGFDDGNVDLDCGNSAQDACTLCVCVCERGGSTAYTARTASVPEVLRVGFEPWYAHKAG